MAKLSGLYRSTETVAAKYAYSINAALMQLERESGIKPVVRAPLGGARTKAECNSLGTPWNVSDHYEAAVNRAAIDLWNWSEYANWNRKRFTAIMNAHGWYNVQVNGRPFPTEPWHWANHSATPLALQISPIEPTTVRTYNMFDITHPLWWHDTARKYIVCDMLTKTARIIGPDDWEYTLIDEENARLNSLGLPYAHKVITEQQWSAAFADYTYVK